MRPVTATLLPRRALLHPVWLGTLGLLALNDHVLKGAGLLPTFVTGKLSDFAGLLVAPLLLAVLLRVRGRVGWIAAHVSVGLVFSAIQLSPDFAALFSSGMGLVGFPWVITCDPWDLIALPMLVASFVFYPRVMGVNNVRRAAEYAAAAGGLAACVATSPPNSPGTWSVEGSVYVHNANDFDVVVRLRYLSPDVFVDCDEVEEAPGRLLTPAMFGETQSWTIWANANLPLAESGESECYAALLEADNVAPQVVFWRAGEPAYGSITGEGIDASAPGFISLSYDGDGRGSVETGIDIAFDLVPPVARPGVCSPPSDAERLTYSDEIPTGTWFVGAADAGVDGCVDLDLRTGFEQDEELPGRQWYLCLPAGAFPFEAGQRVEILPNNFAESSGITIRELEQETNEPTGLELVASAGTDVAPMFGAQALFTPLFDCEAEAEPECGTVSRSGSVTFTGGGFSPVELGVGEPATATGSAGTLDLYLLRAEQRFVLDPACAQGPDELGPDIELIAVRRAN